MTVANAQVLTAAAIVIGAKILIGKGFVYGAAKGAIARNIGNSRHRRQEEDFNSVLTEENKKDADDCAKLLICHLNAKPIDDLDVSLLLSQVSIWLVSLKFCFVFHQEEEYAIATNFGQADMVDVTQATVLYDVAALIGRKAGEAQCRTVYPRCVANVDDIVSEIKKAAYAS